MPNKSPKTRIKITAPSTGSPGGGGGIGGGGPWIVDTTFVKTNNIGANVILFLVLF